MKTDLDYKKINKNSWNNRADAHVNSEFYDNENFLKGKTSLNDIELDIIGDVAGKRILHLQCHFGQDTISFARMGAKCVGMDLSDHAIATAKEMAIKTNVDAEFVCCDIYDLPNHLEGKFDYVFTSYGTIGWLPDLNRWSKVISHFLHPTGKFLMVEFHPFMWMYDDDFTHIKFSYHNTGAIVDSEEGSYADQDSGIKNDYVMWNHGLSEVTNALMDSGLKIDGFEEYNYSPYDCFNKTVEYSPGKYRIEGFGDKVPMVYSLLASWK